MAPTTLSLKTDADVVKTEGRNRISRDEGVLASGSGILRPGRVLGRITASNKLVPLAPAASDGSQTAGAVLLENVDATNADQRVVILSRHAEVVLQALEWPAGITATQQAAALAALEAKGIVARMGV
ncbi:head decoration protein [Methylobacterium organophilum]|uniref:head decoration protein n=1 Tax=Methylobacterium organophilum TaxID=410 RepID=UPI001F129A64|nr:head decoration protein [Methylobacterium organophilum]UMY16653.1 head decoration protein [Methylobacterium organophilum]